MFMFATGLLTLILGAFLPSVVLGQSTSVPHATTVPNTECSALVQYTQTYTSCETHGNCSWAQCDLDQYLLGSTATFWIGKKCADPVMVDLRVDGSSSLGGFRGRFSVGGDNLSADTSGPNSIRIRADYGRNASHLHYHAMALVGGDQAQRLIPKVTVPLNPRECMCQSMQEIANAIRFPVPIPFVSIDSSCLARPDCTGIICNVTISSIGNYAVDVTIDPCGESVRFIGKDLGENGGQFNRVFRDSDNYPFGGSGSLHGTLMIGMVHHNYSMDLSVKLQAQLSSFTIPTENILPSHKIILDRTNCSNITYYYENDTNNAVSTMVPPSSTDGVQTETMPPSPMATTSSPGPPSSSCRDANMLAQSETNCGFFTNCSGVQCVSLSGLQTSLTMEEKCADPVLVNLGVNQGSKKFSVGGDGLTTTEVVVSRRITVEYGRNATHLHFKAVDPSTTLIPEVQLPLYPHSCMCRSMDDIAGSIHLDTPPGMPQVTPRCSKRPNCDGISCNISAGGNGNVYKSQIIVFPCSESVRVIVHNTSDSVVIDKVYADNGDYVVQIPRLPSFQIRLSVGIVHHNYSMDLSIYLHVGILKDPFVILSPHKIILDRSKCANITFYPKFPNTELPTNHPPPISSSSSGSGSQPSSSNTHDQHAPSLSLVVGVPFGILMLLTAVLLIAIITVLVLWRIRKRQRSFHFQRVTFNELNDDEEKN